MCLAEREREIMVTRLLVVDAHPLFRLGVRVELERGTLFVEEASAVDDIGGESVDVALLGHTKTSSCSINDVLQKVRTRLPQATLILLVEDMDEEALFYALKMGVSACCTREVSPSVLLQVVQKVSDGEYLLTIDNLKLAPRHVRFVMETEPVQDCVVVNSEVQISGREVEILNFIARGNSNKQIARSLGISDQTVKNHITSILRKTQANDRTAAVVYGLQHGWIHMNEPD